MDCKTFRTQVADLFDKEVNPQTKAECERHMAECAACRSYFDELANVADMLRPKHFNRAKHVLQENCPTGRMPMNDVRPPFYRHKVRWMKAAAVFLGAACLGGLAFAAWHTFSPKHEHPQTEATALNHKPSTINSTSDSLVTFDGLRLDSILTVVGTYYGKTVWFRNEEAHELRMSTTWNRNQPMSEFLDILNEFDGLRLSAKSDTIFVESVAVEDGK